MSFTENQILEINRIVDARVRKILDTGLMYTMERGEGKPTAQTPNLPVSPKPSTTPPSNDKNVIRAAPAPYEPQTPQPEQPQKQKTLDDVRMSFTEEMEARLTFEPKDGHIIVKPKQFLGSTIFGDVCQVIRQLGGEYISAGKDSHWRV